MLKVTGQTQILNAYWFSYFYFAAEVYPLLWRT